MRADWPGLSETVLRADGGMTESVPAMQFLADILGVPVEIPAVVETTALGAACLAGYKAGVCPDPAVFSEAWRAARRFGPQLDRAAAEAKWDGWQDAVSRTRSLSP
jgi:glycerol kinase